jgi:hypothetical protein
MELQTYSQEFNQNYYITNQTCTSQPPTQTTLTPLALICFFGVLTNLINITVFVNPRITDKCFKYMLVNSISDMVYLSLFLVVYYIPMHFCVAKCQIGSYSYTAQLLFFLFDDYFSSTLAFFNILTDILLSLKRLMIVTNKYYATWISYKVAISACYLLALILYSPVLFLKEIEPSSSPNGTFYTIVPTKFASSGIGTATPIILSSFRIFMGIVVLSTINIVTTLKLKSQLMKKMENNDTKMKRKLKRHINSNNSNFCYK